MYNNNIEFMTIHFFYKQYQVEINKELKKC